MVQATATARFVRTSAQKAGLVLALIRGKDVNRALAKAYATELNRLAKELKLTGSISIDTLMRAPGVLQTNEEMADAEDFWPSVERALKKALDMMLKMREREGANLQNISGSQCGVLLDNLVVEFYGICFPQIEYIEVLAFAANAGLRARNRRMIE